MTTQYKNHSRKRTPWDCNTSLSPMETFIKSKYLDSYDYKHPFIKETMEADLLNSSSKYWLYKLFYIIEDMQDDIVLEVMSISMKHSILLSNLIKLLKMAKN